ncbi:MAG: glycosyltransferase family 1 protein [Chromatiaceae bacterium]|nr:glycosyltransferase family 1 protein [Chromatiaceae bacterium]
MRLLDITMFWAPSSGGVRTYLQAKRDWLRTQPGVEHRLLVPGAGPGCSDGICTVGAPAIPFGHGYRFPLRTAPWLTQLRDIRPDLIEAGDPYRLAWAALQGGRDLQVPVVGFYHSDLARLVNNRLGSWTDDWLDRYLARLYSRFDLVFAPSRIMAEKLRALGVEHVVVQPLGVDTGLFHPARRDESVREELGLGDRTRLLIFAGRGSREKNIPLLLRAMQQLGPGFHLHLVGSHMPSRRPANVSRTVGFLDQRSLARLLASGDALVHAGDRETFGLVVLEAMASGLPVVGVDAGAVPELVALGTGLLAEPQSADALARRIRALFAEDFRAMGVRARRHVVANYDWTAILPALLGHYRELIYDRPVWPRVVNA